MTNNIFAPTNNAFPANATSAPNPFANKPAQTSAIGQGLPF
jgi:hypothetical protein